MSLTVERFVGSGLTGPLPGRPAEFEADDLISLQLRLVYLERTPDFGLDSLALQSSFIADPSRGEPLKPASVLASDARIGRGEHVSRVQQMIADGAAGRTKVLLERSLALPTGATVVIKASRSEVRSREEFPWRPDPEVLLLEDALALHISRSEEQAALWLLAELRGPVPRLDYELDRDEALEPQPTRTINERTSGRPKWTKLQEYQELSILGDGLVVDGAPMVIVGGAPLEQNSDRGLLLFVSATSDPGSLDAGDVEQLGAELEHEAELALRIVSEEETKLSRSRTLVRALEQLRPDSRGRRTLAVLARVVEAELCTDFALIASDELFAVLALQLQGESEELLESTSPEDLAWRLERDVYALLATLDQDDGIPAEVEGVLLRQAGEVGRYPSSIEEAILVSPDLASFQRYIVEENRMFLEDPDPTSRVRAFDWLNIRGLAPEDYNPLGGVKERRAALARDHDLRAGLLEEEQ